MVSGRISGRPFSSVASLLNHESKSCKALRLHRKTSDHTVSYIAFIPVTPAGFFFVGICQKVGAIRRDATRGGKYPHKRINILPHPARVRESQIRKGGMMPPYSIQPTASHLPTYSGPPFWLSLYSVQRRIILWTLSTSKTLHKENLYENFRALPGNAR